MKSRDQLFSMDEARAVIKSYCERESLLIEAGVKLDEKLTKALWEVAGGKKKDAPDYPTEASLDQVHAKLEERMAEHTKVEVDGDSCVRKGGLPKIEIHLTRKGGHNLTRVVGLETYCVKPEALAQDLKKHLNCTTSVEDLPGKDAKDKMMQTQGHVQNELIEYLGK